ncbi:hypothetical protein Runsl_4705 [Runella slithyformis DSM 19594]|uniref:Uncharacterized protein n=1 Tax=Runella slithyformis (strain ATCC 29530 / DSM 19594 / LMG 11500 / NCIMB 11436 / LSU 4) TaxID=761193 RepID=A0A7U4E833_RUNSL|nr:hypothetical protein Runsl_4705 [Runella slithyformis DSM 19594]
MDKYTLMSSKNHKYFSKIYQTVRHWGLVKYNFRLENRLFSTYGLILTGF